MSFAYFEFNRNPVGLTEMNAIDFSKYKEFPNTWKLVTVRYRSDSKEIRLTYANPVAWEYLQRPVNSKNSQVFPTGSVLGKAAFSLEKDPAFTSSEVPSQNRRYQLMVKDSTKYAATGGWGYALFDSNGKIFNEDVKQKTAACFACHQIVQSQDYVFSKLMPLAAGTQANISISSAGRVKWEQVAIGRFDSDLQKKIGKRFQSIQSIAGEIQKNYFSGTFDEIIPSLIEKVKEKNVPAVFYGNADNYSLVTPKGKSCMSVYLKFKGQLTRNEEFCH